MNEMEEIIFSGGPLEGKLIALPIAETAYYFMQPKAPQPIRPAHHGLHPEDYEMKTILYIPEFFVFPDGTEVKIFVCEESRDA